MTDLIGTVVNYRYEILEKCGDGSFFSVFKARDKVLNRLVAIKLLSDSYSRNREFANAIVAESQNTIDLNHQGIAKVLEADHDGSTCFVTTEFVRGATLKERIQKTSPFAVSYAVDIVASVADALEYAHKHGRVHGDVRPHNVIISAEGDVKLTGFGVSDVLSRFPEIREGTMIRSVHYMAPEVIEGSRPTAVSDIYSLGVMLYEMVTGTLPYEGATSAAVAIKVLQDQVQAPQFRNPGIPRSLNDIIMKAMSRDPNQRYASVADFSAALAKIRDWLRTGQSAALPTSIIPPENQVVTDDYSEPRSEGFLKSAIIALVAVLGVAVLTAVIFLKLQGGLGTDTIQVPNLVGKTLEDAQVAAEQIGIKTVVKNEYSDRYTAGQVFQTDPVSGGFVDKAKPMMTLWVSRGPRLKTVPNVVGLSFDEARSKIMDAGFVPGASPPTQYSDRVKVDHVISQDPSAGTPLEPDKPVNLVLSSGPIPGTSEPLTTDTDNTMDDERQRSFSVDVAVPDDADGVQDVRIEVSDAGGDNIVVYEGSHEPGESITKKVVGIGNNVEIKVFIADNLVRDVVYGSSDRPLRNRRY